MRLRAVLTTVALGACVAGAVGYSVTAFSADHLDSPATVAAPTADIADVYAWMNQSNVVLAMTVYPNAPQGAMFDDHVQYVFHTASGQFNPSGPASHGTDIIATFDQSQKLSLWVGTQEFVTGDASQTATPLTSADGKVKVFAGLRADPFFFNLEGFKNVVATVEGAAPSLTFNDAGCPALDQATSNALVGQLKSSADGGAAVNDFASFNSLAIVVEVDKSLLTQGGHLVSVWGATYATAPLGDAGGQ